ncbi:MAG: 2-oxoglutarate dehydrogenase, E2 component, dihydrolipoamide succinyltransferase [Acidobacteriota bacterium]
MLPTQVGRGSWPRAGRGSHEREGDAMRVDVIMPQMGESIAEVPLTRWLQKPGDQVARDEPIFEISTDKVDAEIPAPAAGTLAEVKIAEGETVPVNTVVGVIETDAAAAASAGAPGTAPAARPAAPEAAPPGPAPERAAAAPRAAAPALRPTPAPPAAAPASAPRASALAASGATVEELRRIRSSPVVRRIAREHNLDLSRIRGTGISGRVTKRDVTAALEAGPAAAGAPIAAPAAAPSFAAGERTSVLPMSAMRRKIAEHMVLSRRTSAHVTTVFEVDMSRVMRLRQQNREAFRERHGIKLTVTPFLLKAAVDALKAFPVVNASVDGDNVVYHKDINIGVAVALDWGLIVPVLRNADDRSLSGIAKAVTDLAERARSRKLSPGEVQGGTFTVTNPGVFGSLFGTPIINQPQVAILGVGAITKRPVVVEDAIGIRPMAYLSLSFDHRLLDGAIADQFMSHLKGTLEAGRFPEIV